MNDFQSRAVSAASSAVDHQAQRICEATVVLAVPVRQQYGMAALVAGFRLAAEARLSPEGLARYADAIERDLSDACPPAGARPLRLVTNQQRTRHAQP